MGISTTLSAEALRSQYNIENSSMAYIVEKFHLTPLSEMTPWLNETATDFFVRDYVKKVEVEASEDVIDRVVYTLSRDYDPDDGMLDMVHIYEIKTSGIPYTDEEIGEVGAYCMADFEDVIGDHIEEEMTKETVWEI